VIQASGQGGLLDQHLDVARLLDQIGQDRLDDDALLEPARAARRGQPHLSHAPARQP
jgi:hypothetical protein